MIDWLVLAWALLAGAGIGLFYFGGLWWTANQLTRTNRPGLLFMASFVGRTGLSVLGFYLVMGDRWERAAAAVVGFLLARLLTVRYWGLRPVDQAK
ncbi:MAG: ATPase F0F1 [Chloroflexi bacterium]|nr:MAG: ATPase F0F1 [Chloroflexota bacterium]